MLEIIGARPVGWRIIALIIVFLIAIFASSPNSITQAQSNPEPAGPGVYQVAEPTWYDFGPDDYFRSSIQGRETYPQEIRARVYYPSELPGSNKKYPLIIIMHGMNATCASQGASEGEYLWPCVAPQDRIPNYEGYEYLGRHLASSGFIVASISANGMNYMTSTGGAVHEQDLERAELMHEHLKYWLQWNNGVEGPFEKGNSTLFEGKVDLQRVGLIGHSRGGGGAVRELSYNREHGNNFGIKGVLLLAPANESTSRITTTGTPMGVVLPYCDGTVLDLSGIAYFDDDRYNDNESRHAFYMLGANHNYYSTEWSKPPPYGPGDTQYGDDWKRFYASDKTNGHCWPAASSRLSPEQQRSSLLPYARAFFTFYIQDSNDAQSIDYLTGDVSSSIGRIYTSYHPGRKTSH